MTERLAVSVGIGLKLPCSDCTGVRLKASTVSRRPLTSISPWWLWTMPSRL